MPVAKCLFLPGRLAITTAAFDVIDDSGQDPMFFIEMHLTGEWGQLDRHDWHENLVALKTGARLLSKYKTLKGEDIYIITEAVGEDGKRPSTTILLPKEY